MIQQPTVFVVGAGASAPFGFPSGQDLLRQHKDINLDALEACLAHWIGPADARQLHESFRQSEDDSIDALLEFRGELELAGKTFMALKLLACEQ